MVSKKPLINSRFIFYFCAAIIIGLIITIWQINLAKVHKASDAQIQQIQNISQTNLKNWLEKSPKSGIELTVLGKKVLDK
ncbi:MAG: hypothetical protein M1338_05360 [Patescibacteria group bacterium]|nr:hypothetical protein [Patescibacteria group bacterium]